MESLGLASPNGPPSTTYTYDAFGNPTASGASSSYPFLFQGLEHETGDAPGVYYLSNGEYYASQIERELQQVGAVRLVGPGLSGGTHHRRSHHASGGGGHRVRFVANDGELGGGGGSGGQGFDFSYGNGDSGVNIGGWKNIPIIGPLIQDILDLFGGGDKPPPLRKQMHRVHPLFERFIEVKKGLIMGEQSLTLTIPVSSWAPGHTINSGGTPSAGILLVVNDQTYGLPSEFWSWYHRQIKKPGDPDLNKEDARRWAKVWEEEGEPDAEGHRTKFSVVLPFFGEFSLPIFGPVPVFDPVLVF